MGRILITGASGNVGRYVAQYALENGQEITAAGTRTGKLSEMFQEIQHGYGNPVYDDAFWICKGSHLRL